MLSIIASHRLSFADVGKMAAVAALYVLVARLGLKLDAVSGFATLVWAPTGISLAVLLLFGYRFSPAVLVGALAVNLWAGASVPVAIGIAIGNTSEALLGAYAMRRFARFHGSFDRLRHVLGLIVLAAMLSTIASAGIGVASLLAGGVVSLAGVRDTFRAWWVGDMLGDLVVAPLLLTWATVTSFKIKPLRLLEAVGLCASLAAACYAVFTRSLPSARHPFESPYVLFPLFMWAAVRFELRGATAATAFASALAIWGTVRGCGPFSRDTLSSSLLALQTFMGSAALTPLVVAGAMSDRARSIRVRETFAATVSHDLKNPLGAISVSAESLSRAVPPDVADGRAQKHADLVRRNVDRMTRLIASLLDASAIEAGQLSVEKRPHDAGAIIEEAVEVAQPLAAVKRQTLVPESDESVFAMCDQERVLQVLSNLIGNAIKFTEEGGTIIVRVERAGRSACFSVKDTGRGIEPANIRHVFERHWHAQRATGGGTGLGLFIAKGIVEAHEGKLWAESARGKGSTFYFTLPLSEQHASLKR
jgi:signal transduction histidine kinase